MVSVTFTNPEYLWFLLGLPLLIATHFFLLRYSKRRALTFANFKVLKRATGNKYITKNSTILVIRLLILTFAILAVSGMVFWYEAQTNENEYVLAIDTSASMTAQDIMPTRLDAAKEYAGRFIDSLDSGTRVGLVSFSGVTFIESPLSRDHGEVASSLRDIEVEASGTDIPGAIITSTNLLEGVERGKAIVLLTDGSSTIETFQSRSVQRAVQYAVTNRVRVYTVGIGSTGGAIGYLPTYYNISSQYNVENLRFIANETGARHYDATDAQALEAAYDDILSQQQESLLQRDLTPGLMLLVLLLLLVEWGLLNTRFRLLP